ncbi:uncharacterized protein RSE6_03118 [Rhynchosporium secalis]|uniref:Uncharacterized protein n=1 Tax=Rhynchosporium secalis TaxID=38038 RepID=A0A1E1M211_RHYSE|nr:uncharacterized protein RSE6_03118 [Rhynchosporium secalis]
MSAPTETSRTSNSQVAPNSRFRSRFLFRSGKIYSSTLPSTAPSQNMESAIYEPEDTPLSANETTLRSGSVRKAAQILGLKEEAVRAGQQYCFERNLRRFQQDTPLAEQTPGRSPPQKSTNSKTTTGRSRASTYPIALPSWIRKAYDLKSTQDTETRRKSATGSAAIKSHSPPNSATKSFSLSSIRRTSLRRVFETVRRRFTGSSLSLPVFEDDDEEFFLDLGSNRRGFSLDLPPDVSQDKSEIDNIRRKNIDAYLNLNSDVIPPPGFNDEEVDWEKMDNNPPAMTPDNSQRLSTSSSNLTTSEAPSLPANLPEQTIPEETTASTSAAASSEMWKEVVWHPEPTRNWVLTNVAPHDTSREDGGAENESQPLGESAKSRKGWLEATEGIALYRSLIAQSLQIPLPHEFTSHEYGEKGYEKINPIKHFIRKKFRQNTHHASPRLIVSALEAGYAAEELLYSAIIGSTTALSQIHGLLHTLHRQRLLARQRCAQPAPRPTAALKARLRAYPGAGKVVDTRPLPLSKLSANRHVPSLTIATFLPFLRFKKEQSPYLSRVLSQKTKLKQKRTNWIDVLEMQVEMGNMEGEWEDCVLEAVEDEGKAEESKGLERLGWGSEDESWAVEADKSRKQVLRNIYKEYSNAKRLADRLVGVVKEERDLWEWERSQRKEKKWKAKGYVVEEKSFQRKEKGEEKFATWKPLSAS